MVIGPYLVWAKRSTGVFVRQILVIVAGALYAAIAVVPRPPTGGRVRELEFHISAFKFEI
jgi:hypothetical protein